MWNNLPTEITNNILHRLPVKTLIKCTILSKSFLSLITSHDFISTHIAQYANSHLLLRYFTKDKQEIYRFDADDDTFSGFQTQGLLVPFLNYPDKCFTVAGCVNGVLCLVNDFGMEGTLIILWNPSIRKFVHVPRPIIVVQSYGPYQSVCGFGFDPISVDYKVVRLVQLDSGDGPSSETQVEVYSLKSGCWRVIGVGPCYSIKQCSTGYTPHFINGSVYWLGTPYAFPNCETVLLKFDMSTESFETIQLPSILQDTGLIFGGTSDFFINEYNGNLTLIKRNYNGEIKTCSAWLMKEDGVVKSWTKMFDFSIAKLHPCGMPRTFGFKKNGEVIMVKGGHDIFARHESETVIVSTDLVTHSMTTLSDIRVDCFSYYLSTYVETMVLFKEGKGIEQQTTQLDLLQLRKHDDLIGKRNPEECIT
ncbi:F-box protein CPR1-like [Silene latifolia]|uniref:F-box protein CPR1-like n=1 Tax=Silene latifolia TaxID=37657 RepID=UPI003D78A151